MSSLYSLTTELISLLDSPEEVPEETLEELSGQMMAKVGDYAKYFTVADAHQEMIQKEIDRLTVRKKVMAANKDRVWNRLKMCLEAAQIESLTTPDQLFTVSIQKNPPSLVVDDEKKIPAKFFTISTVKAIDKAALKKALKSGEVKEGCHIEHATRLVIK